MDIGLALSHVTRDPQWVKKVLIGGVLIIIPILGGLIVYGFSIRLARNVIQGMDQPVPEWDDFGGDLGRGFMGAIGVIVWGLPIWILSACGQILSSGDNGAAALGLFLSLCIALPLQLAFGAVIFPTIVGRFAATGELGSMFQFNEVLTTIRTTGAGNYLMFLVLYIVASILSALGLIACLIGVLFTSAYAIYAIGHGIGQLYRRSQSVAPGMPQTQHPAF